MKLKLLFLFLDTPTHLFFIAGVCCCFQLRVCILCQEVGPYSSSLPNLLAIQYNKFDDRIIHKTKTPYIVQTPLNRQQPCQRNLIRLKTKIAPNLVSPPYFLQEPPESMMNLSFPVALPVVVR